MPSGRAKAKRISPATGSTHAAPVSGKRISPVRVETDSSAQIPVSAAPARIRSSPRAVPAFFLTATSTGMMTSESTGMMMLTGEGSGVLPSDYQLRAREPVSDPSDSSVRATSLLHIIDGCPSLRGAKTGAP